MLESTRQYVREKLSSSGEMKIICLRHLDFFAEMAAEAERSFKGQNQSLWYGRLDNELDNLRAALTWGIGNENIETQLRLAAGLWRYWKNRGHSSEGRGYLQRILDRLPPGAARRTSACARALTAAGSLAYYEGDISYSEQTRTEALAIFRELADKVGIADCLNGLGNTALSQGNYDASRALYEESLLIRRELGDTWGVARLLGNLGLLAYFQVDYAQSHSLHLESLALFRELQDQEGVVNELVNLGDIFHAQREPSTADSFYRESAMIARRLKDQWGLAYAIKGLADVAFEQGDFSTASSYYDECLILFQKGADYAGLPFALESVAALARAKNQLEKAARIFGAADALRKRTHTPLPPPNHNTHQINLSILRQQLDPATFAMAWIEGSAMTMDQAITYALEK
jgi:tetratricopeptide (TPR) repeat protein